MLYCDFFPVGAVIPYAGPLAKTDQAEGFNLELTQSNLAKAGWLFCDGSAVSSKECWELFDIIGTAYGGDGEQFYLPDLRGRFIRGVDGGSGNDPDANERITSREKGNNGDQIGSLQNDAFQGHEHDYIGTIESPDPAQSGEGATILIQNPKLVQTANVVEEEGYGCPRVAKETRPVNLYLNYLIRYRHCVIHDDSDYWPLL
ncbi:phage tail protein [Neptuniibacter sp. PT34_22]|uniref:phage tail protein n=1 Tax=Neptuniibacter sp. PT34_22 TaxID=3398205 RepID=UPI0039F4E4EC